MSLKHALLGLIDLEPGSGYDLTQRIRNSIGFFWPSTHQQIYKALHELLHEGCLDVEEEPQQHRPDRRIYSMTQHGREELQRWLDKPSPPTKIRDAFLIRVFCAHLWDEAHLVERLNDEQQRHQHVWEVYQRLAGRMDQWPESRRKRYRFARHTLQLGIYIEEAWQRWCRELQELYADK